MILAQQTNYKLKREKLSTKADLSIESENSAERKAINCKIETKQTNSRFQQLES